MTINIPGRGQVSVQPGSRPGFYYVEGMGEIPMRMLAQIGGGGPAPPRVLCPAPPNPPITV